TAHETRALVAIMIALAVVLGAYGFYQVFIGLPADRAGYAADPDRVLRELGQWVPGGPPERRQFQGRLRSNGAVAAFRLTNWLARCLAPWLIMALGVGLSLFGRGTTDGQSNWSRWLAPLGLAVGILVIAGCLVLTKSRSAYVAVTVGVLLLPACLG